MRQQHLTNALDEPAFIINRDKGLLVDCNKAATHFLQLTRAELLKVTPFDLFRKATLANLSVLGWIHIAYTGCKLPRERLEQIESLPARSFDLTINQIKTGGS